MKTYVATPENREREWFDVDAGLLEADAEHGAACHCTSILRVRLTDPLASPIRRSATRNGALARIENASMSKALSWSPALEDSIHGFSREEQGSMEAVAMEPCPQHSPTTLAVSSGPWSRRRYSVAPLLGGVLPPDRQHERHMKALGCA